jgi:hypothetical protein
MGSTSARIAHSRAVLLFALDAAGEEDVEAPGPHTHAICGFGRASPCGTMAG